MIKQTWIDHGTKLLGLATIVVSSALSANAMIQPGQSPLIPPDHMKWFLLANVLLGALTVKRGFTNSNSQTPPSP